MARGLQKEQSQQKAKAKADAAKGGNSLIGKDKGLKYKCSSCMQEIDSLSNMKLHWDNKHPKLPVPDFDATCKKAEKK